MKIFDFVIDYSIYELFDLNVLKKSYILPIQLNGITLEIFYCKESSYDSILNYNIEKKSKITKEEILFFLEDIKTRKTLFSLCLKSINSKDKDNFYIEDFVLILIKKAIENRTSDIHIESLENTVILRFRIDGKLKIFYIFEKRFLQILSSFLKMLSKLDITQNRVPMDGRFCLDINNLKYDFRISTMPTIFGESIVIRILDNRTISTKIKDLGFSDSIIASLEEIKRLNSGLVLIAGPTGSGKSTTLYSMLKDLNSEDKKIITIEDPVEYKLQQIQQIEVNDSIDVGFKRVLKNILRQDPDIVLIGEIRDEVSLNIALQASLTGHLVFASIHANSSLETLSRLIDLKADRYLLSQALKFVISQRLVLNICKECKKSGCKVCNYSGFFGRSCIAEILKVDKNISSIIFENKDLSQYLKTINFKTILDDGKEKINKGITTLDEVLKVIND